jgi:hypothetical protein
VANLFALCAPKTEKDGVPEALQEVTVTTGERISHRLLLDWIALRFISCKISSLTCSHNPEFLGAMFLAQSPRVMIQRFNGIRDAARQEPRVGHTAIWFHRHSKHKFEIQSPRCWLLFRWRCERRADHPGKI